MLCFRSADGQRWYGSVDSQHFMWIIKAENKKSIGVSTYTAHKYTDFPTHDVVVMGSSDTPSTHLMAQPLAETLKKKD